jgi:uncharacterized protein
MKLLDVNVWLAAVWGSHVHHEVARNWFDGQDDDLAFCRITQMGLLRIVTNPTVVGDEALSRRRAWELFGDLMGDPRVHFLSEPPGLDPLWMAFSKRDDSSHRLWTDDYLAAFAQGANVELATLDRAFHKRYPSVKVSTLK